MYAPCKNCCDRKIGCHSKCEKYAAFKEECEHINKTRTEMKLRQSYDFDRKRKIL